MPELMCEKSFESRLTNQEICACIRCPVFIVHSFQTSYSAVHLTT